MEKMINDEKNINKIEMSTLSKTWIFDLDGTLVKHNGYKIDGFDTVLDGVIEYLSNIPDSDTIIILTARECQYKEQTIDFLREHNIRFDNIIFDIPMGERIVINDRKTTGLDMAFAININRDCFSVPAISREK